MSTPGFPFSAVVGHDDLRLALLLNAVHPGIGGVLVRGEKGTAKSTAVRALAALLPLVAIVPGCRFSCDPSAPDPACPDGPHGVEGGSATGLGLLDLDVSFDASKHLGNPTGTAWGEAVAGYEIHHGRVTRSGDPHLVDGEGSDAGAVLGTHWHGLLENDGFRRLLLTRVAAQAGRAGFTVAEGTSFAAARASQLDLLGDLVEKHLDTRSLDHVISHGAAPDLPVVTSGLAVSPG